jgi:hypothetical protein
VQITVPPPLVVHIETQVQSAAVIPPASSLGCPVLEHDEPIGTLVDPVAVDSHLDWSAVVHAASRAPQLAVRHDRFVWVSDDRGRSFRRAFEDREVTHTAITPSGVIYARAGTELGVRSPGGKTVWRPITVPCDENARCVSRIGTLGEEVLFLIDELLYASADRGKTWKKLDDTSASWHGHDGTLFTYQGALFQVDHHQDMCGIDDLYTYRLDANHRLTHDIFHNYYIKDEPVLRASSDVDTTWTWTTQCMDDDRPAPGGCPAAAANRVGLLTAATLRPVEGARALAVYKGSLIELCAGGARQVYRSFPFESIDAVDDAGRALVVRGATLLRWSPVHGWRKLKTFVDPVIDQSSD